MSNIKDRMKYSDRALTTEQLMERVPAAFAETPHFSRSEKYGFFKTHEVIAALEKEGFQAFMASQPASKTKTAHCKHLIRFRHMALMDSTGDDTLPGVIPEISLVNSHDGSSPYTLHAGIYRKVCDNGLYVSLATFNSIKVRHSNKLVNDVIDASYKIIEGSSKVLDRIEAMQKVNLLEDQRVAFATKALAVKFQDKPVTLSAEKILEARRQEDTAPDLWTTFNVIQENIVRGGLNSVSVKNNKSKTKPIVNLNENIRVNQALWSLADEFVTA